MKTAAKVVLWSGVVVVCTLTGVLIGLNRRAVGRFVAGDESHEIISDQAAAAKRDAARSITEPAREAVIGWKAVKAETIELNPLDYRSLGFARRAMRTKVTIQANTAVFFGVFQQSQWEEHRRSSQPLRQGDFEKSKCGRVGIVETDFECELEPGDMLILRDKRAQGSMLLGLFGFTTRNNEGVNRATAGNKVHYEIAEWACIQNCTAREPSRSLNFIADQQNRNCTNTWLGSVCAGQRYVAITEGQRFSDANVQCATLNGRLACVVGRAQKSNCEHTWVGSVCDGQEFVDTFKNNPFQWHEYTCGYNAAARFGGCIVPSERP